LQSVAHSGWACNSLYPLRIANPQRACVKYAKLL